MTCQLKLIRCATAAALVAAASVAVPAPAAEPMAVVAFSGYDALMNDIDMLGSLAGQEQASQQVESMLGQFVEGLDKTKPIGLVLQSNSGMPEPLLCIPVADVDALLKVANRNNIPAEDIGDGVLQIQTPAMPLFGKEKDGWLLVSIAPGSLDAAPDDPGAVLAKLTDKYDLGVTAFVQNIPQAYREQLVQLIGRFVEDALANMPKDAGDDKQEQANQLQQGLDEIRQAINELDQITAGVAVNQQSANVVVEFSSTVLPGTSAAEQVAKLKETTTDFAGFFDPDAAMMLTLSAPMADVEQAQLQQQLAMFKKQAEMEIDRSNDLSDAGKQKMKAAVSELFDAGAASAANGELDGGAVLNLSASALTFVAGFATSEPQRFEAAVRKMVEVGQEEATDDMPAVTWNAETYKDYAIHKFSKDVADEEDAEARRFVGDALEFGLGVGVDAIYFGAGRDWLAKVKSVIDASAASPDKNVPPMEMTFSVGQFANFAEAASDEGERSLPTMIATMIENEANGRDHVRIVVLPIENGQLVRIEAEEGVLRAIGLAATSAQPQPVGR